MKTVPVTLPDWVWGRAATLADDRDVKVADLLAEGLLAVLASDTHRLRQLERSLREVRAENRTIPLRARSVGGRRVSTHCSRGHELTGDNVRVFIRPSDGYLERRCRTCTREANRKARARRRERQAQAEAAAS